MPNATFIVDLEAGKEPEPEAFKDIIEVWEGYEYKVGDVEVFP